MRPPRIAILVLFFSATIFLFCRSVISLAIAHKPDPAAVPAHDVQPEPVVDPVAPSAQSSSYNAYGSFFSLWSPYSIFPPNAIITLTDDNGTSFPARPAAFGHSFPKTGLSGQLWIGSGFAEDNLQDGDGEGELGCSDIPGWDDNKQNIRINTESKRLGGSTMPSATTDETRHQKRQDHLAVDVESSGNKVPRPESLEAPVNDGTDDYLAAGLKPSEKQKTDASGTESSHADIESLQESAEIEGKVVLLSRGGCGFAEKVLWAQRRGAIAVIVGDNQRGGPLIQMYARGDTSNITISSVFTSRTTAHLLSSLMHPGSFLRDISGEGGNLAANVQQSKAQGKYSHAPVLESIAPEESKFDKKFGWLARFFPWGAGSASVPSAPAPEGTRRQDWIATEDWDETKNKGVMEEKMDEAKQGTASSSDAKPGTQGKGGDSFQIGVQDWRDPDLFDSVRVDSGPARKDGQHKAAGATQMDGVKTPGSGQYGKNGRASNEGFMSKIFSDADRADSTDGWSDEDEERPGEPLPANPNPDGEPHEGLWVTITPTSSASPFLDTLLVLVVSPLITLTVVYALLVLRARIRRRRWRAPKSVIDRLPVRTYHTVEPTPSTTPRRPSPTSSSPRTPLLQQPAIGGPSRPRPRSRTSTGIPDAADRIRPDSGIPPLSRPSSRTRERERRSNGTSQWKKYMGRQVECVVCLEEYVDGVSRVMSLPCGHEFHAECITPWLTTRRRTCPICKGDVVRSLARHGSGASGPRYEPYRDDNEEDQDDLLVQSSSSSVDTGQDVEAGLGLQSGSQSRRSRRGGWSGRLHGVAAQLGWFGSNRASRQEDRDR